MPMDSFGCIPTQQTGSPRTTVPAGIKPKFIKHLRTLYIGQESPLMKSPNSWGKLLFHGNSFFTTFNLAVLIRSQCALLLYIFPFAILSILTNLVWLSQLLHMAAKECCEILNNSFLLYLYLKSSNKMWYWLFTLAATGTLNGGIINWLIFIKLFNEIYLNHFDLKYLYLLIIICIFPYKYFRRNIIYFENKIICIYFFT